MKACFHKSVSVRVRRERLWESYVLSPSFRMHINTHDGEDSPLDYLEINALRYAAVFVIRSDSSAHHLKVAIKLI